MGNPVEDLAVAEKLEKTDFQAAAAAYKLLLSSASEDTSEETLKAKEVALVKLGELYQRHNAANEIAELLQRSRPFLSIISKAKAAKLVKSMIELLSTIPSALPLQIAVTQESIEWSKAEKRIFLKQSLETRLATLYLQNHQYHDAIALTSTLLRELKKLDDKMMLVEVQLIESRVYFELKNFSKSRAALTTARSAANSIYCPPLLQAELDMQSGILHAQDKDFKTAYSYFFEALEGYSTRDDTQAILALKYMLLCKIMLNATDDIASIMHSKTAIRYAGPDVDAMRAVAKAGKERSLHDFEAAVAQHKKELQEDPIIRSHLADLHHTLLLQNLKRIIEPFSRVEISHIAELIRLDVAVVEAKLSQMILDKELRGVVDQGAGSLIVFDEPSSEKTYEAALATMDSMNKVVDALFVKASKLS